MTTISAPNATNNLFMSPSKNMNNRSKITPNRTVHKSKGNVETNQSGNSFKSSLSTLNSARLPPIDSPGQSRSARKNLEAKSTQTTSAILQNDASVAVLTNNLTNLSVTDRRPNLTQSTSPNRSKT